MKTDFDKMTRRFLMGEDLRGANIFVYLQALNETLKSMNPKTSTGIRRLEIAREHLKEVKRHARRVTQHVVTLEEQLRVLEEGKETE